MDELTQRNDLEEWLYILQRCHTTLLEYLDKKRNIFPRFYLLSEADLLDIFSHGEISRIISSKHLPKLFIAIQSFLLNEAESSSISHIISNVGDERIRFPVPIQLGGKPEVYLWEVLSEIQRTLKKNIIAASKRYSEISRIHWIMERNTEGDLIFAAQVYKMMLNPLQLSFYSARLY